jgi:hypothetical protein
MDMLAMHRVYPGLVAIMPANIGGFGDLQKSLEVYHELEVRAMQRVFLGINEQIGRNALAFRVSITIQKFPSITIENFPG